jgi:hypothetical protein
VNSHLVTFLDDKSHYSEFPTEFLTLIKSSGEKQQMKLLVSVFMRGRLGFRVPWLPGDKAPWPLEALAPWGCCGISDQAEISLEDLELY